MLDPDPHRLRGDARLAARLIAMGVVSEDQAATLLKQGHRLAVLAAQQNDTRAYRRCMQVVLACAGLEQRERLAQQGLGVGPGVGNVNGDLHVHNNQRTIIVKLAGNERPDRIRDQGPGAATLHVAGNGEADQRPGGDR